MTYCVGLLLESGIVMLSDTRTNAGFDNIACYRKMFVFEASGERVVTILTAGNLSVTQTVIAKLRQEIARRGPGDLDHAWRRRCCRWPRSSGGR